LMGALGLGLVVLGSEPAIGAVMVAVWGFAFGAVPVAWSTWLTRTVPDQAESAGGLLVGGIQFAIAVGAAGGGAIFDTSGGIGVFTASSFVLLLAALMIVAGVRSRQVAAAA
ncbi:MFS transporter, partial [Rhizobiaceae sp. 2RAB30]